MHRMLSKIILPYNETKLNSSVTTIECKTGKKGRADAFKY